MFDIQKETIEWAGRPLTIETGRVARQADGAVMVTYGDTTVLATAVGVKQVKEGVDFFPLAEPVIEGAATRVMSLRDGTKKMSKSDPSDASRINMTDDADAIAKKIRKAKTDPDPLPETLAGLDTRPEARNLVNIYAALAETTAEAVVTEFAGQQFGSFKPALADLAVAKLAPISAEMSRLMADPGEIDRILAHGAEQAREITAPILKKTYEIVGMVGA